VADHREAMVFDGVVLIRGLAKTMCFGSAGTLQSPTGDDAYGTGCSLVSIETVWETPAPFYEKVILLGNLYDKATNSLNHQA
jgi:hypothetical protein